MVSKEFIEIIDQDIQKCEDAVKHGGKSHNHQLFRLLLSKYDRIIDGFSENLLSLFYDEDGSNAKDNLETMRQKLVLFKAMGYENRYAEKPDSVHIENTNKVSIKITNSFSEARTAVEEMTTLKDAEIEEILAKINELEEIVNSKERKSKKWANAGEIIKWIAEKGIDVGLTLLPLLLKLGE